MYVPNPTFAQVVLKRLVRRLALWAACLLPKTDLDKGPDKPPEEVSGAANIGEAGTSQRDPLTSAVVRNGNAVSLNGVALSSYPHSAHEIRSASESSVRLEQPNSRASSRNRGSDTHFIAPSTGDIIPTAPTSRPSSQLGNRISIDNLSWFSRRRSPSPSLPPPPIIVDAPRSLAEDHSDATEVHAHFQPEASNTLSERLADPTPCDSPLSDQIETTFHGDETNLKVSHGSSLRPPSRSPSSTTSSHPSPSIEGNVHEPMTPEIISLTQGISRRAHTSMPALPQDSRRYDRRTKISKKWTNIDLQPMTIVFEKPSSRPGWISLVHPEGARYFYHAEKRVYTDSDLYDPVVYDRLMDEILELECSIQSLHMSMPEKAVLMVDVFYADNDRSCLESEYYYADLTERAVFYLEPLETVHMACMFDLYGPKSIQHLGFEIRSQYWYFVSLYPHCSTLTDEMLRELRDIVLFLIGDQMTSPNSTAFYTTEDLFKILSLLDSMEKNIGKTTDGITCSFARYMYIFYHSKFVNCYGETFSRVEHNVSIFGDKLDKKTWVLKMLSPLLFLAPDIHIRNLRRMWIDRNLYKVVWERLVGKLNNEWQQCILLATVMLSSNVGYLSIQGVDLNGGTARSPGQIASYLSLISNIGSIILGLLLMRQNQTKKDADIDLGGVLGKDHQLLGVETVAILFSLPYALLIWGVVAFLVAFFCLFFQNSTTECRVWVGSLSFLVLILIVWCIITFWGKEYQALPQSYPLVSVEAPLYEEESEEAQSIRAPTKNIRVLLDILRNLPNLVRGGSAASDDTAV
ncbi:hypothetical protein HYPSUDRAFT_218249 [Hypholoma sublateritium FD-334 SS-4]|uniref:WW domain-containing protein n=1 Tax=Hypholoma sublateritium (strain FD-334 SS-4) TaxID=945553 RepID=A0A0D2M5I2_HYPSF|nr:hypothetical protein HYPSUDRAFT_218249 [Hypholoma sublateritium FD-334 SS-4]